MGEPLMTEAQWRTLDDFRKYWNAFADADVIPIDGDDFTARLEAEGYIEMEKVTRRLLRDVSFPEERGLELGGWCWALTDKGRAALSETPSSDTGKGGEDA